MENHHFVWENHYKLSFSYAIAMLNYRRVSSTGIIQIWKAYHGKTVGQSKLGAFLWMNGFSGLWLCEGTTWNSLDVLLSQSKANHFGASLYLDGGFLKCYPQIIHF